MKAIYRPMILMTILCMLLGCGTPAWMYRVEGLINTGQCGTADNEIYENEPDPAERAVWLAGVADECYRDRTKTISYLTLGARYGHPIAQEELARRGQPIPPVDLRGTNTNCAVFGGLLSCTSN